MERTRDLKKNTGHSFRAKMILLITFFFIFLVGFLLGSAVISKAQATDDLTPAYKYYTSVAIESGDSLWRLADKYMDSHYNSRQEFIQEVMQMNGLKSECIQQGNYLNIPYYSEEKK